MLDGLDRLLEPGVLPYVPKPAMGAAVGCEWLFGALPGALAGGFRALQGVRDFPCGALHGSCPIDAQHPKDKGQDDCHEPQPEGEKWVHGCLSKNNQCQHCRSKKQCGCCCFPYRLPVNASALLDTVQGLCALACAEVRNDGFCCHISLQMRRWRLLQ